MLLAWCQGGQDRPLGCHVCLDHLVDEIEALLREADDDLAAVVGGRPLDETALLEAVDAIGDGAGGDIVWRTRSPAVSS